MFSKIKIKVDVFHPKNFLLSLISKKIPLYDISFEEESIILIIDYKDLDMIQKMKTIKKLKIIQEYGFLGIYYFLKRNSFLLICFLFGIFINIFLSKLIFTVDVFSPNQELVNQIQEDLKEYGISPFLFQPSYDEIQIIKNKIILKEKNYVEWLEIEKSGVKVVVKVEEKKIEKQEKNCLFRNIISRKKAILTRVEGETGEIIHRNNELVLKGDVVISGEVHNNEEVVSKKCAKGKIYGEVWYKVLLTFPLKGKKIKNTNHSKWGIFLDTNHFEFLLPTYFQSDVSKYSLIKSYVFPFSFGFSKSVEQISYDVDYSFKNINKIAYQSGIKELEKKLSSNIVVLRKKILKKEINNSKIIIEVFFSVEEDITDYQIIEE